MQMYEDFLNKRPNNMKNSLIEYFRRNHPLKIDVPDIGKAESPTSTDRYRGLRF